MLRVFGALLLPLCGWLTGDAFQQRTRERLCALEWSIRLLQRIRQEIAFRRADLTQLDAQLQREGLLETPAKPRALQALAPPKALSEAEQACFAECMSGLGRTSAEQECERLDYYIARFQEFLQQAQQLAETPIAPEEYQNRLDLRQTPIFTIDSASSKDLDDAVSISRTANG